MKQKKYRQKAASNKRNLTDRFLKTVKPGPTRTLVWDTKVEGLVLAIEPTGHKMWCYYYRHHNRTRWYRIATLGRLGLRDARDEARRLNAKRTLDPNYDPQAEKVAARQAGTFEDLAKRYIEEHAKQRLKSWQQSEFKINRYLLPRWRHFQATAIRRADVRAMFNAITNAGAPIA